MIVRLFGGFDFVEADADTRSPAVIGYTKGVPMGADLGAAPAGKAPTFLVAALKDPIGANLDRYQIVKGLVDAEGAMHEKVYDVVWSGDRQLGADGKVPPVGSSVDVANATWTNMIGAPELIAVWKDPDFDPAQRASIRSRVSRFRRRAGRRTTQNTLASKWRRKYPCKCRSAPTRHRSGIRLRSSGSGMRASAMGQKRKLGCSPGRSALPLKSDTTQVIWCRCQMAIWCRCHMSMR